MFVKFAFTGMYPSLPRFYEKA